jgi:hypothetical protein
MPVVGFVNQGAAKPSAYLAAAFRKRAENWSCRLIRRLPIGLAGVTAVAGGAHDRHAAGHLGGDLGDHLPAYDPCIAAPITM